MKNKWETLHKQRRFCPVYPSEAVVQWTFRNFPQKKGKQFRILDLGCGAGRHLVFLDQEGYEAKGCDSSLAGIEEADVRLGTCAHTVRCEADDLRFPDNYFDGVICYSVLHYLPLERIPAAVQEIHRVLKKGGKALIVTRNSNDSRFHGKVPKAERGMTMTALFRPLILELFSAFKVVRIDHWKFTEDGGKFNNDDWHIHVEK